MPYSVMIVDDSEDILDLVAQALVRKEYQVTTAVTCLDALELIASGLRPNVILLDVEMPDMKGMDFLDLLEARYPDVITSSAIIFFTAGEFPKDPRAQGCLSKMSDMHSTLHLVKDLVNNPKAEIRH